MLSLIGTILADDIHQMALRGGYRLSGASFNRASASLEDPFASTISTASDTGSTYSAPILRGRANAPGGTPTRSTQSLANSRSSSALRADDSSLSESPVSDFAETTSQPEFSQSNPPQLSSAGDTGSPRSADALSSPVRQDRVGQEINDENAQGFYGPGHSVFFGNLPMSLTNDVLQNRIKEDLECRVGRCYVTISRDHRNIPIAFASFTSEADAQLALQEGSHCVVGHRALRPEAPKGNFIFVVFKNDGAEVSRDEIDAAFEGKGPIHHCFVPDPTMRGYYDLPKNVKCVQMATFGDFRDARRSFHRTISGLNITPLSKIGQPRPLPRPHVPPRLPMVDALTIYVGNLPSPCFKHDLLDLFKSVGTVRGVHIVSGNKLMVAAQKQENTTFAFVEFTEPTAVFEAICLFNNHIWHNQVLRVEFRLQTKLALEQLQREIHGYMARCVNHFGCQPPSEMITGYLSARNTCMTTPYLPMARNAPADPIGFYVASLMGIQPPI